MKILVVSPRPNYGGAAQVLLNLIHETSKHNNSNFQWNFLFLQSGLASNEFESIGKVYISPFDKQLIQKLFIGPLRYILKFANYLYAIWIYRKIDPDIFYLNSISKNPFSMAFNNLKKVPKLMHAHEMDFLVTMNQKEEWVYSLLENSSKIIVCSKAVASFYEDNYGINNDKICIVHGPSNFSRLLKRTSTENFREKHGIHPREIILGTISNISFLKGPDIMCRALQIVIRNLPQEIVSNFRFVWVGAPINSNNKYFQSILKLSEELGLEDKIQFLPPTYDVRSFLECIDFFILPSRTEAFPLVVLEALLFEKPVVAMDVGGVREVIDSQTGYLVKDRTPEGLAEGILHFINNPDMGKIAGKNGKKRVLENFEAEVQSKKWIEILNSL